MASGTPVVTVPDAALVEVAGDAAIVVAGGRARGRDPPGPRRSRAARRGRARARPRVQLGGDGRGDRPGLRRGSRPMSVSAVVVSHGHAGRARALLPALAPQVDELVVVANRAGLRARRAAGERAPARERAAAPLAENVNLGTRGDLGRLGPLREPGRRARARRGRGARSRSSTARPRCGIAGPRVVWPDGTLAAVAPAVPDGRRHARPPDAAPAGLPAARAPARRTTCSTRTPTSRSRPTGCSAPSC